ncbi:ShlB/FhaC/HecB family hemolysin secretion/activation protein, partial [Rhizobium sp. BR 315]
MPFGKWKLRSQRAALGAAAAVALSSVMIGSAFAQTASQVTPQSFEPQLQKQSSGIVIPEASGPVAPKGAEKLTVRLKTVKVEGGLPGFAEDEARVANSLSGRRVTAAA